MNAREVTRRYTQGRRAATTEETGWRILDAARDLFVEAPFAQITFAQVADRAGVTVQTIIRRFGDKEGLFAAAAERAYANVASERDGAPDDDLAGALANLADHYETTGDLALKLLAEEHASSFIERITNSGRAYHRDWCARVFASALHGLDGADHVRRQAQLVAVCDVYTWKLLRRDAGLSRNQYILALSELLEPLLRRK